MKFKVNTKCRVAHPKDAGVKQVQFSVGIHDVAAFPKWAVERMAQLGYAEALDEDEKAKQAELDDAEMEARAKAQAEAEAAKKPDFKKAAEAKNRAKGKV